VLGKVSATRYTDRVQVRLLSGQASADFAKCADNLAQGFGALLCRVRTARSGRVVLEFVRRDALAALIPAVPIPAAPDLKALPVGRREDGLPWCVRLHGTHVLVAGATGAGKASLLWGLVRALFPLIQAGLVRVLAADPKWMELAYGRAIFDRYGRYAADPASIAAMLDLAVADMQGRAARFAGRQRDHTPTIEDPFTVVLVDEVAFLTAYQPDRKLKERIMLALATLTTQGRALGYSVVAALQDPRNDVLTIRNLFPDRIAMRLDEPEQVDMVLGDGAYDRGATCELISSDPSTGAGVAFVRLEGDPDPVRVRAGWVSDADICALATASVLAFAVADGRVQLNVAAAARNPTSGQARREGQALTLAEVASLTEGCKGRTATWFRSWRWPGCDGVSWPGSRSLTGYGLPVLACGCGVRC
jgi:DNA segregation ATPase FtsK/SpoIIIE, S-DNA-T family